MKIIYTRKAQNDLRNIRAYYAPRSPSGLRNIVSDIVGVVEDIPNSIAKGRQTPHPDVWEKVTPKYGYILPYYVSNGTLFILRVYHPKRGDLNYSDLIPRA